MIGSLLVVCAIDTCAVCGFRAGRLGLVGVVLLIGCCGYYVGLLFKFGCSFDLWWL